MMTACWAIRVSAPLGGGCGGKDGVDAGCGWRRRPKRVDGICGDVQQHNAVTMAPILFSLVLNSSCSLIQVRQMTSSSVHTQSAGKKNCLLQNYWSEKHT